MIDGAVDLLGVYVHCLYIYRCSGIQGIYAQLTGGRSTMDICALSIYIERSAMRCAKAGVAVFKASMLD